MHVGVVQAYVDGACKCHQCPWCFFLLQMAEFLKMMEEVDEQEIKVPFGELEKGTVYKLLQLKRTTAMYLQKEIRGMHASMETPEGLKIFTYLPKKYVDMKEELFQEINAKGPTSGPYGIAYYGTIGGANMSKLHAPGEGIMSLCLFDVVLCDSIVPI